MAYWAARVKEFQTITFGLKNRARVSGEVTGDSEGQTVEIRLPDDVFEVRLNLLGRHNASNALAAASVAWACGRSPDEIRAGLQRVEAQPGRLQVRAGARGSTLIDDTYNANPTSLKAAIRARATWPNWEHALKSFMLKPGGKPANPALICCLPADPLRVWPARHSGKTHGALIPQKT